VSRVLVTGATGFVGRAVLDRWSAERPGDELLATGDGGPPAGLSPSQFRAADLTEPGAAASLVAWACPDAVVHLAGQIRGDDLEELLRTNVLATHQLYEALAAGGPAGRVRVVQASSAAVYGPPETEDGCLPEDHPLRPVSVYGLSKAAQELAASVALARHGLQVIRARFFNLVGPGQPAFLVPMGFLVQLVGGGDEVRAGDLSPRRDFLDVRDAAAAVVRLATAGTPGLAYNVASGREVSIREVLDLVARVTGRTLRTVQAPGAAPGPGVPRARADVTRIGTDTGWSADIPLETSLRDMWETLA